MMRRLANLTLASLVALAGCAPSPGYSRPPRTADAGWFRPGDALDLLSVESYLSGLFVVDAAGTIDVPACGRVVVTTRPPEELPGVIADCWVERDMFESAPSVSLRLRERPATATLVVGSARAERRVDLLPGATLIWLLANQTEPGSGAVREEVTLERRGRSYVIDVEAIVDGVQDDEPLEPGDTVRLDADVPLRTLPPARPPVASHSPPERPLDLSHESCGALTLRAVVGRAAGRGERHPETLAIRAAAPTACISDDGSSLHAACMASARERATRFAAGMGPMHPEMRPLVIERDYCEEFDHPPPAPPPTAADCAALETKRAALVAAGKGRAHPEMRGVEAQIEVCVASVRQP